MISCTFAGHREIYDCNIQKRVEAALDGILANDRAFVFYSGDMGEFDQMCASVVRNAKRRHPELDMRLIAVLPYMRNDINTNRAYYESCFDDIIVPIELADVHYKAAILRRNQWMIDHADYLIACVIRDFGGAYAAMQYAAKQGKRILNLAEMR